MTNAILTLRKMIQNPYKDDMSVRALCVAYVKHRLRSVRMHPGESLRGADITTIRERTIRDKALEELRQMGLGGHLDNYPV